MFSQEEKLTKTICDLYEKISKLETLKPSEDVNILFNQLVSTCITPTNPNIDVTKMSNTIQEIRLNLIKICGEAESQLEHHFSSILTSFQDNPLLHLNIFPYYNNYLKLGKLEFDLLTQNLNGFIPKSIAFIGSGPLPLTSIVLASFHLKDTIFHNFDIDPSANSLASLLVSSDLDISQRMIFHTVDIMDVTEILKSFDVVFLAALVGMNKNDKVKVIEHLEKHMAPGSVLMLRSAHGSRAFLYPIVEPCELQGFEVLSVYHPTDDVINSVLVSKKLSATTTSCLLKHCNCSKIHGVMSKKMNMMIEKFGDREEQIS